MQTLLPFCKQTSSTRWHLRGRLPAVSARGSGIPCSPPSRILRSPEVGYKATALVPQTLSSYVLLVDPPPSISWPPALTVPLYGLPWDTKSLQLLPYLGNHRSPKNLEPCSAPLQEMFLSRTATGRWLRGLSETLAPFSILGNSAICCCHPWAIFYL